MMYDNVTLVTFLRTFNSFTMETLLATSFGHEVNILKGEGDEFTKAAEGIFAMFGTNLVVWIDTLLCNCS